MQEVQFEIDAQRVGRASGYLGGLTIERYTFTGATIPAGTRLAILTRAGVTIAAAEIAEGNAATVDTNTQEVADLLRYQPLGACESVYIAIGNADTIIALIPAVMRKNWLDDEATHPPVPANRYPTKTELDAWLARFDERAAAAETAKADAQEAAAQAAQRATDARAAKTAAESAATAAQTAQGKAEAAQAAAETAQKGAESAKDAAASSATASEQSAQAAAEGVTTLLQGKVDAAEAAKAGAEAAQTAAETAKAGADAAKAAAASSATAADKSATAAAKSATDLADAVSTAESLDGRIMGLETASGIYPSADGAHTYEARLPVPFGDGTLKRMKDLPHFMKFMPSEVNESFYKGYTLSHFDDGVYAYIGRVEYNNFVFLHIYDKTLKRVVKFNFGIGNNFFVGCCVFDGEHVYGMSQHHGTTNHWIAKYLPDGTLVKRVSVADELDHIEGAFFSSHIVMKNPLSGHLIILDTKVRNTENGWAQYIYNAEDLTFIEKRYIPYDDGTDYNILTGYRNRPVYLHNRLYLLTGSVILAFGEDDRPSPVREAVPKVGEDGYLVYTPDADGNWQIDNYMNYSKGAIVPDTEPGEIIRFRCAVGDERPLCKAGGAFKHRPIFVDSNFYGDARFVFAFDGVDCYWVTTRGEFINPYRIWTTKGDFWNYRWSIINTPYDSNGNKHLVLRDAWDRSSGFTTSKTNLYPCSNGMELFSAFLVYRCDATDANFPFSLATGNPIYNAGEPPILSTKKLFGPVDRMNVTYDNNDICYASPIGATWAMFGIKGDAFIMNYLAAKGMLI